MTGDACVAPTHQFVKRDDRCRDGPGMTGALRMIRVDIRGTEAGWT